MNELGMICNELNIDTHEVIKAASTKWNFLPFYPGLVGGHCISVDPYYLTYRARRVIVLARKLMITCELLKNTLKLMTKWSKISKSKLVFRITLKKL